MVPHMAISNELSSDIAAALIAANAKKPDKLYELREILIKVHSTLQQMKEQSRIARSFYLAAAEHDRPNR